MWKALSLAVLMAATPASPLCAQDDAAALVLRLTGSVDVRHGMSDPSPASVGQRLSAGDQVVPGPGARALLLTRTGATLDVQEAITLPEAMANGDADLFAMAVRTLAQAASADARNAGGRQGMIRPVPGEPELVAPRNGLAIGTTRPTFTWTPVDGAEGYTIQIRAVDGGGLRRWETSAVPMWSLPPDDDALTAGTTYAWTVAPASGRPTREQRFRTLDPTESAAVADRLRELSELGVDPAGDGRFLSAVVYRDAGLYYEAAAALEDLETAAGGDFAAELFMLQGEILNRVGRADEATAAFDRADALLR